MRLFLPRPLQPLMLVALAAVLPFAAGSGCGRTACFAFSTTAYQKNGNACPAQNMALPSFTDSACPGPVVSVDGEGSFDGELCCYPVTEEDIQPNCGQGAATGTGVGGFRGVGGFGTSGFGGSSGFGVSEVSSTSSGPPPPCTSLCAEALTVGGAPCSTGSSAYAALKACAGCNSTSGACVALCGNLCDSLPVDTTCSSCLEAQCPGELTNCVND